MFFRIIIRQLSQKNRFFQKCREVFLFAEFFLCENVDGKIVAMNVFISQSKPRRAISSLQKSTQTSPEIFISEEKFTLISLN